jgi:hypothetical protein
MKHPDKEQQEKESAQDKPGEERAPDKGIVQAMIDEMKPPPQAATPEQGPPRGPLHPPEPAELDQDAGGGYNPDGTFPQT